MKTLFLILITVIIFATACEKEVFTHKSNKTEDDFIKESVNNSIKDTEEVFNDIDKAKAKIKENEKKGDNMVSPVQMQSENKILLNEAMKLKKEGKFKEAIKVLERVLRDEPKNISILENLSELYTNIKNFSKAKDYALLVLKQSKNNIFALTIIGNFYAKNNQVDKAIEIYIKLTKIDSNSVLLYNIGVLYEKQGKLRKAFEYYKKAIRKKSSADGYYSLALISKKLNNNKDVIKFLEQSINKGGSIKVKRFLAREYLNQKMYNKAIVIYEKISNKSNNIEDYNDLANAYIFMKNYYKAEKIYKKVLILSPDNQNLQYNLALCYFKMKSPIKMQQVIKEYERGGASITSIRKLKVYLSKISK